MYSYNFAFLPLPYHNESVVFRIVINEVFRKPVDMVMTVADDMAFADATGCHACGGDLDNERVRDHCHITGKYRGAAHNACNLKLRIYPI